MRACHVFEILFGGGGGREWGPLLFPITVLDKWLRQQRRALHLKQWDKKSLFCLGLGAPGTSEEIRFNDVCFNSCRVLSTEKSLNLSIRETIAGIARLS